MNENDILSQPTPPNEHGNDAQSPSERNDATDTSESSITELFQHQPVSSGEEDSLPEAPFFMMIYTTLMLILLTFFIVLASMASPSHEKFQHGMKSVNLNFNVFGLSGSQQVLNFMYSILRIENISIKGALDLHAQSKNELDDSEEKEEGELISDDKFSKVEATQLNRLIALGFDVNMPEKEDHYVNITLPQNELFKKGTATLTYVSVKKIRNFLRLIGSNYSKIDVRCFCFDVPKQETGMVNQLELSLLRAEIVAQLIRDTHKKDASQIGAIGYGKYYADEINLSPERNAIFSIDIYGLWQDSEAM